MRSWPYCMSEGIGVIVYSPMASGLLTGAMTCERAARLPADGLARAESRLYRTESLSQSGAGRALASGGQTAKTVLFGESGNRLDAGQSRRDRAPSSEPAMRSRQRESCVLASSPHG